MSYRSTTLLVVFAAAVWGYLFFFDSSSLQKSTPKEQGVALLSASADSIQELSLTNEKGQATLQKKDGAWRVSAPVSDRVEELSVQSLLAQLGYARSARVLSERDPSFGLSPPLATLSLKLEGKGLTLLVGADAVGGQFFYGLVKERDQLLLLPRSLKELLLKDPGSLRAQQAFPVARGEITKLSWEGFSFFVKDGVWRVLAPVKGRLDPSRQEALLRAVEDLRVVRFEDSSPPPTPNGRAITLNTQKEEMTLTLFGPVRQNDEALYFAKRDGAGFWLEANAVEALFSQEGELRDRRLFATSQKVDALTFRAGEKSFTVKRAEKGWTTTPKSEVDTREVERFLEELKRLTVLEFPKEVPSSQPTSQEVRPSLELALSDGSKVTLSVGQQTSEETRLVYRDEEPVIVSEEIVLLCWPDSLRFAPKLLLTVKTSEAKSLVVKTPKGETRLEKRASGWWVLSPFEALADARSVGGLLSYFEELRAARLLEPSQVPSNTGLSSPSYQLKIALSSGEEHTLSLGAAANAQEVYASLSGRRDPFTVRKMMELALQAKLIELRPFVSLSVEGLQGVSLSSPEKSLSLTFTGQSWKGSDGREVSPQEALSFVEGVADITAEEVIAPSPVYQTASPLLTGEFLSSSQRLSFSLFASVEDPQRFALRVNGVGPVYLLTKEESDYLWALLK